MKKKRKAFKKELRKKLTTIVLAYMDGLSNKQHKKISRYIEAKMGDVVGQYDAKLKKNKKKPVAPLTGTPPSTNHFPAESITISETEVVASPVS